ncbi:hypothetical protein B0O99DRAFT_261916 [Bisporella sp. PMI_857]|nr:hypothetical protein B0O99DRAFT_261916 [Bisporella sp. PMI_857]
MLLFPNGCIKITFLKLEQQVFYRLCLQVVIGSRLAQQFVVNCFVCCESTTLLGIRNKKNSVRRYIGVQDRLRPVISFRIAIFLQLMGLKVILLASYTGCGRAMQSLCCG